MARDGPSMLSTPPLYAYQIRGYMSPRIYISIYLNMGRHLSTTAVSLAAGTCREVGGADEVQEGG